MFQWPDSIDIFGINVKNKPKIGCDTCLYIHESELKTWKCICDCHDKTTQKDVNDFLDNGATD